MKFQNLYLFGLILIVFTAPATSVAQSLEERARETLENNKAALVVVTVQSSLEAKTTGDPLPARAQQRRTLGVTIGDDGLIVVSNSAIDASVGLEGQQAQLGEDVVSIQSANSVFQSVEISYGDTTLLSGKVVRQDEGADVAFIMPDQSEAETLGKKFEFVDLSKFAATAQAADQVIGLSRASGVYGYMPIMTVGRITGIFKSDRTYFVTEAGTAQGIPIFTMDGNPVGVTVVRIIDGKPSGVLGTLSAGSIQIMANLAREAAE
ncbi:MAG: hypothetical protein CMO47_13835 [Verrucomicrobiales bacterium]|nr:hypothetical protein [Verrucomicrobiales bacterium]|tara:strand:+ start:5760 stop:6551 length:792 start_codon:yes stop_codon:yes gene_type:complete